MWKKKIITAEEFHNNIIKLANMIPKDKYKLIYAIPRGGLIVGVYLSHYLDLDLLNTNEFIAKYMEYSNTNDKDIIKTILIVDDLVDTGETLRKYVDVFDLATVYMKPRSIVKPTYYVEERSNDTWIVFPWEKPEEEPNREI